jgi:hypothetical protein
MAGPVKKKVNKTESFSFLIPDLGSRASYCIISKMNYFVLKSQAPGGYPRSMKKLHLFLSRRGGVNPLPSLKIADSNFFRFVNHARLGAGGD